MNEEINNASEQARPERHPLKTADRRSIPAKGRDVEGTGERRSRDEGGTRSGIHGRVEFVELPLQLHAIVIGVGGAALASAPIGTQTIKSFHLLYPVRPIREAGHRNRRLEGKAEYIVERRAEFGLLGIFPESDHQAAALRSDLCCNLPEFIYRGHGRPACWPNIVSARRPLSQSGRQPAHSSCEPPAS